MTIRQRVLKIIYPLVMWWMRRRGKNISVLSEKISPPVSFYSLEAEMNNGQKVDFEKFRGKKVLLVNTASDCGYTNQYDDLQKLFLDYKDDLVVLGFPSNDYKEQEKGSDAEIAEFCRVNFGITFPLMKKSVVKRSEQQNVVYQWLTDPQKNGWNKKAPSWNFSKYLVNEKGELTNYFGPTVLPFNKEILKAIKNEPGRRENR
jgi:glutathione peroxidase